MSEDRQILEHHVTVGVIEVAVRVDQDAERLAGDLADRVPEHPAEARVLLSVDDDHPIGRLDRACIRVAARSDPSVNTGSYGYKSGFICHTACVYDDDNPGNVRRRDRRHVGGRRPMASVSVGPGQSPSHDARTRSQTTRFAQGRLD